MAYQWTPLTDPPSTAPWIDDPADFTIQSGVITSLPTWHIQIPSRADACRIIPIGVGADDGTLQSLTIHGINFGMSSEVPGEGVKVSNGLVQDLCICSAPKLGIEAVATGFGKAVQMRLCKSLGTFNPGDYYKDLDRAFGLTSFDGTDELFSARQFDNDSYSEIIIGNLNGMTHIGAGVAAGTLAASGTVTAFNLLVSFRIQE